MNHKKYWNEIASPGFAHLTKGKGKGLGKKSPVLAKHKVNFLEQVDFYEQIVIDYGIGGGWLGRYLFKNKNIRRYIGIDIADRSIKAAKKTLENWKEHCEFHLSGIEFSRFEANIFISLACIQHFPSREYFDDFLNNINNSSINIIVLQIRYDENTTFNNAYEKNPSDSHDLVAVACKTNEKYISSKLVNYKNSFISVVYHNKYQYLIYCCD